MLLSETELRAALEPMLDRLLSERLRLFQLQLEARLNTLLGAAPPTAAPAEPGLQRLFEAQEPGQCFEVLLEQTRALVGPARALLVEWRGELAVWRSLDGAGPSAPAARIPRDGLELPARFPSTEAEAVLRGLRRQPILVRGRAVGHLCWRGGEPGSAAQKQLYLLVHAAGLALLNLVGAGPSAPAARVPLVLA
ncbi:MAG: hypothetical protein ACRD1L_14660, partial [Terriglobales bacterium]